MGIFAINTKKSTTTQRFWVEDSGVAGIIFGLAFIPTFLVMGAAIDYANAIAVRSKLQSAVDSASIAIAQADPSLSLDARQALAQNLVTAKLGPAAARYNLSVAASALASGYKVTATVAVPTSVMRIARFETMPVSASAGAMDAQVIVQGGGGGCVLSLNESAVEALDWNGNADVSLKNCDIYGNSGAGDALQVGGSAKLSARRVSVHGNVSVQGGGVLLAEKAVGQPRMRDPYEKTPLPAFSGCDQNGFSTNDGIELSPGVYCNGLSINTNSGSKGPVTLKPGLYVIDGGQFLINSQAKVQGTGVTIVFTKRLGSSWANARINGGAQIDLSAPSKDGPTVAGAIPGVLLYGDRAMATGTEFKLNGGSSQTLTGAVYLPEAKLTFNGGAEVASGCLQIIADTVTFTGDTNVSIEGCGDYEVQSFGYSLAKTARVAF